MNSSKKMMILESFLMVVCVLRCLTAQEQNIGEDDYKKYKLGARYPGDLPLNANSKKLHTTACVTQDFQVQFHEDAWKGYLLSYVEIHIYIAPGTKVSFEVLSGGTGQTSIDFRITANATDHLSFDYMIYGLTVEDYDMYHVT